MYIRRIALLLFAAVLSLPLQSCMLMPKEEGELAPPLAEPPKVTWNTVMVQRTDIVKSVSVNANFIPFQQTTACFKQGGRLLKVDVKPGQDVKEGDLLAELDSGDLEYQIAQKQIQIDKAKYQLSKTSEGIDTAKLDIEALNTDLNHMNKEYADLLVNGSPKEISDLEYQISLKTIQAKRLEMQIGDNSASTLAEYDLKALELDMDHLKTQLAGAKLTAPAAGKIDFIADIGPGDYINSYDTLFVIMQRSELILQYKGPGASDFNLDQEADVTLLGDKRIYKAVVVQTPTSVPLDQLDNFKDTVRFAMKGDIPQIEPGQMATVTRIIGKSENVLAVPNNTVKTSGGEQFVYILKDGARYEQAVKTGLKNETMTEIKEGLNEGDVVIIG